MLHLNTLFDATVTGCEFRGTTWVPNQNGVFISGNARMARIAGNTFVDMQPGNGSCIVPFYDSRFTWITNNTFINVRNPVLPLGTEIYRSGNNPAP